MIQIVLDCLTVATDILGKMNGGEIHGMVQAGCVVINQPGDKT